MCDLGFTDPELALIRAAIVAAALAVATLLLAYAGKLLSEWLRWKK